jgi:Carbohydrate/starch-binding module (family 21)
MNAVALLSASAESVGDGIDNGGFVPATQFSVLVQNLAYTKLVGIWGHDVGTGTWGFTPCSYSRSVPGNLEIWVTDPSGAGITIPGQFDVEYQALGNVYWDNNAGYNYNMGEPILDEGTATAVIGPNVLAGLPSVLTAQGESSGQVDPSGNLNVGVMVKNIAYEKQVGIVYTTNNWLTHQYAFGKFLQCFPPASTPHQLNAQSWQVMAPVGVGATGQYAAFYTVAGTTYWDNNFGLNYSF